MIIAAMFFGLLALVFINVPIASIAKLSCDASSAYRLKRGRKM